MLTLQFMSCLEFNFCTRYSPSDSHTNTVISTRFARQDGVENRDKAYYIAHETFFILLSRNFEEIKIFVGQYTA